MKAAHYVAAAVILAVAAATLFAGVVLERRIAEGQRALATLDVAEAERAYAGIEDTLGRAVLLPGLGGLRGDLVTRRAAARYWRSDHEALVAEHTGPAPSGSDLPPDLPFLLANAGYRANLDREQDRQALADAVTRAIADYRRILEGSSRHLDAAFNFEYLIRLRARLARGEERPAASIPDLHGREGAPPPESDLEELRIYVPLEDEARPGDDVKPTIGQPIQKRG